MKTSRFVFLLLAATSVFAWAGISSSEAAQKAKLTFEPMAPVKPAPKQAGVIQGNVAKPLAGLPSAPGTTTPLLAPNQGKPLLGNGVPNARDLARIH